MIMPYLSFGGCCEEAFGRYAEVFGGEIRHMARYGDAPENPAMPLAREQRNKVMHAQVRLGDTGELSGADALWPVEQGSAVCIHAHMESEEEAARVFDALAQGGAVLGALAVNPPPDDSGVSGMVRDRYGFTWVISALR